MCRAERVHASWAKLLHKGDRASADRVKDVDGPRCPVLDLNRVAVRITGAWNPEHLAAIDRKAAIKSAPKTPFVLCVIAALTIVRGLTCVGQRSSLVLHGYARIVRIGRVRVMVPRAVAGHLG
jgi:hypothetical protein